MIPQVIEKNQSKAWLIGKVNLNEGEEQKQSSEVFMLECLEKRVYGVQLALASAALPPSWAAVCPLLAWQPPFVISSPVSSIERALQKKVTADLYLLPTEQFLLS